MPVVLRSSRSFRIRSARSLRGCRTGAVSAFSSISCCRPRTRLNTLPSSGPFSPRRDSSVFTSKVTLFVYRPCLDEPLGLVGEVGDEPDFLGIGIPHCRVQVRQVLVGIDVVPKL